MAINKIQGNILSDNLVRGSNLAFQTNLIYLDVINGRVGINGSSPNDEFDVVGTAKVSNIRITSSVANGIFFANNDQLALTTLDLIWDGNALSVTGNVNAISGNFSQTLDVTGNLTAGNIAAIGSFDVASIVASGNIQGNNLISNNDVTTVTVTASGNVMANIVQATAGFYSANVIANNLQANLQVITNDLVATANISAGNVLVGNITVESTGNINMGYGWITDLSDPVANSDAATKGYVDTTIDDFTGNITFSNTTISTSFVDANLVLEPTGTGLLIVDTTTGLVLPAGNTVQQPSPALAGTIRFNTDLGRVEVYDGSSWDDVVANVTNQILYGDNSTQTFTLDKSTTDAAALVAFNGVVQLPGVAYTVTGNQITFAQPPAVSDIIDVRFL